LTPWNLKLEGPGPKVCELWIVGLDSVLQLLRRLNQGTQTRLRVFSTDLERLNDFQSGAHQDLLLVVADSYHTRVGNSPNKTIFFPHPSTLGESLPDVEGSECSVDSSRSLQVIIGQAQPGARLSSLVISGLLFTPQMILRKADQVICAVL